MLRTIPEYDYELAGWYIDFSKVNQKCVNVTICTSSGEYKFEYDANGRKDLECLKRAVDFALDIVEK